MFVKRGSTLFEPRMNTIIKVDAIIFFFKSVFIQGHPIYSRASLNGALTQHKNKDIKTRKLIKLHRQHVPQALLFNMAIYLDFKFAERLYSSHNSR